MRAESPVAFGLHPNAEIAVKTKQAVDLFTYIMDLQPRSSASAGGADIQSPQAVVQMLIQQVVNDKAKGIEGINFLLDDIAAAVVDERGPYQNVFLQEVSREEKPHHVASACRFPFDCSPPCSLLFSHSPSASV
jgi:dynein heavy chain